MLQLRLTKGLQVCAILCAICGSCAFINACILALVFIIFFFMGKPKMPALQSTLIDYYSGLGIVTLSFYLNICVIPGLWIWVTLNKKRLDCSKVVRTLLIMSFSLSLLTALALPFWFSVWIKLFRITWPTVVLTTIYCVLLGILLLLFKKAELMEE